MKLYNKIAKYAVCCSLFFFVNSIYSQRYFEYYNNISSDIRIEKFFDSDDFFYQDQDTISIRQIRIENIISQPKIDSLTFDVLCEQMFINRRYGLDPVLYEFGEKTYYSEYIDSLKTKLSMYFLGKIKNGCKYDVESYLIAVSGRTNESPYYSIILFLINLHKNQLSSIIKVSTFLNFIKPLGSCNFMYETYYQSDVVFDPVEITPLDWMPKIYSTYFHIDENGYIVKDRVEMRREYPDY